MKSGCGEEQKTNICISKKREHGGDRVIIPECFLICSFWPARPILG